jgi:hypothetical protein
LRRHAERLHDLLSPLLQIIISRLLPGKVATL